MYIYAHVCVWVLEMARTRYLKRPDRIRCSVPEARLTGSCELLCIVLGMEL